MFGFVNENYLKQLENVKAVDYVPKCINLWGTNFN